MPLVMIVAVSCACNRAREPAASATHAESPQPVETEPAPYLANGCPAGPHDVRQWQRIDPAAITEDQAVSLNYSPCSWDVHVRDGTITAEEHRDPQPSPSLPPTTRLPEQWGPPGIVRSGRLGVLLGFNHGEWGGALLWYANDGRFIRKLLDENIVELLPTANGLTALVGLTHLARDSGRGIELIETESSYRLGRSAELGSAPRAVAMESSGAILIATMAGLVRLDRDFRIQPVLRAQWLMFLPVSLAVREGTAYVGMRGIVAEVQLGPDTATETWLAPAALR